MGARSLGSFKNLGLRQGLAEFRVPCLSRAPVGSKLSLRCHALRGHLRLMPLEVFRAAIKRSLRDFEYRDGCCFNQNYIFVNDASGNYLPRPSTFRRSCSDRAVAMGLLGAGWLSAVYSGT